MDTVIYLFARWVVGFLQALPLVWVARLGRAGGALAFWLDGRHRNVALKNLTLCFGKEKSPEEIRAIAKENFKRIGENFFSSIKTAAMSFDQLQSDLEFSGFDRLPLKNDAAGNLNAVMAVGHFGNFELYARIHDRRPDYQGATTYRAFKQPALNRLMQSLRGRNGCLFFERRSDGTRLRERINRGGVLLGLLADQSAPGLRAPFLGHDCNTGLAPAVLALRYKAELFTAICRRVGLAHWRLEAGESIATHENGQPRPATDIMRDVNRTLEAAVRLDPANWFWVHRRWKD